MEQIDTEFPPLEKTTNLRNINSNQSIPPSNLWSSLENSPILKEDLYIQQKKEKLNDLVFKLLKSFKNIPEFNSKISLWWNNVSYKSPTFLNKLTYWISWPYSMRFDHVFDWMNWLSSWQKQEEKQNDWKKEQQQLIESIISSNNSASKAMQNFVSTFKTLDWQYYTKIPCPLNLSPEKLSSFYIDYLWKGESIYQQLSKIASETKKLSFGNIVFNPFRYAIGHNPIPILTMFQIESMFDSYKTSLINIYVTLEDLSKYIDKSKGKTNNLYISQSLSWESIKHIENIKKINKAISCLEKSEEYNKIIKSDWNWDVILDNIKLFKKEIKVSLKYIDEMIRKEDLKESIFKIKLNFIKLLQEETLDKFNINIDLLKKIKIKESNYPIIESEILSQFETIREIYSQLCNYLWIDWEILFIDWKLLISEDIKNLFIYNNPNYIKNLKTTLYMSGSEPLVDLENQPEFIFNSWDENSIEIKSEQDSSYLWEMDETEYTSISWKEIKLWDFSQIDISSPWETNPVIMSESISPDQIDWIESFSPKSDLSIDIKKDKEQKPLNDLQNQFKQDTINILNIRITNSKRRIETKLKNKIIRYMLNNKIQKLFNEEPKSIHEAIKTYINMCNNYIEKYLKSYSKKDKEQLFIEKLNQFFVREEKYNEFIKSNLYKSIIEKLKD